MGSVDWKMMTAEIASVLGPYGIDLIHPFRREWYDDAVETAARLPGPEGPETLSVLAGNTRAMWPRFLEGADRTLDDALDGWIEETFSRALTPITSVRDVIFSHEPPPRRLPMQRLARHSGFTPLSEGQLLAHPVYGPWFALRAVIVTDVPGPSGARPAVGPPCAGCDAPCKPAFEHACEANDARVKPGLLRQNWRPWLAVRDACPVGRDHRYSEEQIRFHYGRAWPGAG